MEQRLEIRQKLQAAGVIAGVVDDFLPLRKFYLVYGQKNISLGDEVSPADVQSKPDRFSYDDYEPQPKTTFGNSIFILVRRFNSYDFVI